MRNLKYKGKAWWPLVCGRRSDLFVGEFLLVSEFRVRLGVPAVPDCFVPGGSEGVAQCGHRVSADPSLVGRGGSRGRQPRRSPSRATRCSRGSGASFHVMLTGARRVGCGGRGGGTASGGKGSECRAFWTQGWCAPHPTKTLTVSFRSPATHRPHTAACRRGPCRRGGKGAGRWARGRNSESASGPARGLGGPHGGPGVPGSSEAHVDRAGC